MTDHINPITIAAPKKGNKGHVTVEMLHDMVARSNRMKWVIDSGQPYFVNRKWEEDDKLILGGKWVHFLDRRS